MDNKSNRPPFPPRQFRGQGQPTQPGSHKPPEQSNQPSSLGNSDVVNVTGKLGPGRKDPPPVIVSKLGDEPLYSGKSTVVILEDGTEIVKYAQPQKLNKLLKDAKSHLGGESSRFYGKGWVIGQGVAKIAPDGTSITYYSAEIGELVRDLLGPDSETI